MQLTWQTEYWIFTWYSIQMVCESWNRQTNLFRRVWFAIANLLAFRRSAFKNIVLTSPWTACRKPNSDEVFQVFSSVFHLVWIHNLYLGNWAADSRTLRCCVSWKSQVPGCVWSYSLGRRYSSYCLLAQHAPSFSRIRLHSLSHRNKNSW